MKEHGEGVEESYEILLWMSLMSKVREGKGRRVSE